MDNFRTLDEFTEGYFRAHPEEIEDFLTEIFQNFAEDNDISVLLASLRIIARVKGITTLATRTGMTRQGLQKALSDEGNPRLLNVAAIMSAMGYYLLPHRLLESAEVTEPKSVDLSAQMNTALSKAREWFHGLFEGEWVEASMVLAPAYRSRNNEQDILERIRRAKTIDLGSGHCVLLVIEITPESENQFGVVVQVYPSAGARHLPVGLQITALDMFGNTILGDQAEVGADSIQLEIGIELEEKFSIQLSLGAEVVIEHI